MSRAKQLTLADLVESFFRNRLAAQRRASPETISAYRDAMKLLIKFAAGKSGKKPCSLSLDDIGRETVLEFLDHLEKERGNSIRTRNARLTAIRSFFQHVAYADPASMGIVQRVLGIPRKRMTKTVVGYLTRDELDMLLASPDRSTPMGRRHYALLLFLARTGARVSEAIGVNAADLRLDRPLQVLLHGKGSKDRIVPVKEDLAGILRELCFEQKSELLSDSPVFVNSRGQRLSRYGVIYILKRAVKKATDKNPELARHSVSPHKLRHSNAMHLLQSDVGLETIRNWLGHADINTTHQYIDADVEMKRRALESCGISDVAPTRYKPDDKLLAILENL